MLRALALAAILLSVLAGKASAACLGYVAGSTPLTGWAASWDVFSPSKLLIQTDCPTSGGTLSLTVGYASTAQIVYGTVYTKVGAGSWQAVTLSGEAVGSGWVRGPATASTSIPGTVTDTNPMSISAYVCTARSDGWKCGCRDVACAQSFWQLQSYVPEDQTPTGEVDWIYPPPPPDCVCIFDEYKMLGFS